MRHAVCACRSDAPTASRANKPRKALSVTNPSWAKAFRARRLAPRVQFALEPQEAQWHVLMQCALNMGLPEELADGAAPQRAFLFAKIRASRARRRRTLFIATIAGPGSSPQPRP